VLERFGVDTIGLGRGFGFHETDWTAWALPDGTECLVPTWTHIERQQDRWVIRAESG
jgi:uroporphyrinogen decarboxylase